MPQSVDRQTREEEREEEGSEGEVGVGVEATAATGGDTPCELEITLAIESCRPCQPPASAPGHNHTVCFHLIRQLETMHD